MIRIVSLIALMFLATVAGWSLEALLPYRDLLLGLMLLLLITPWLPGAGRGHDWR